MSHKSTALQVAGRTVRLVVVNSRIYVPLRFLVEETLDMRWEGQRKRLAALAQRWRMADLLVSGQRKMHQQPCLPAGMVLPFLWLLRPTKPEILTRLERLRDGWDAALMAYLKLDGSELANIGSFQIAEIERSTLPLIAQITELEKRLAEARSGPVPPGRVMAEQRWKKESLNGDSFREMARLNDQGKTLAAIARILGCSRTTVSLFLAGKYKTGAAGKVFDELVGAGWKKTACLCAVNGPPSDDRGRGNT